MANFITIMVSLAATVILPKFLELEQYGYWQVYLFYTSYVGLMHLGLNDGIYLRYGGESYNKLDYSMFHGQYKILLIVELCMAFVVIGISVAKMTDEYMLIWIGLALCMLLTNVRYMFIYILQATNRIKEFAVITIMDRILFMFFMFLFIKQTTFVYFIVADLIARLFSLIIGQIYCKEIVLSSGKCDSTVISEITKNIAAGIQLLFANLASSCIIGIVRYGIQKCWDITVFGRISFMLSISNLFVIFINAMSVVIYPLLRRIHESKQRDYYFVLDNLLSAILCFLLMFYYPIKEIISWWLPEYREAMRYVCVLFPLFIFEGKTALLYNTYLKVHRKENLIFKINLVFVFISFVCTILFAFIYRDLDCAVFAILFLIAGRCFTSQVICAKIVDQNYRFDITATSLYVCFYLLIGLNFAGLKAYIYLTFIIIAYEVIRLKKTLAAFRFIKEKV